MRFSLRPMGFLLPLALAVVAILLLLQLGLISLQHNANRSALGEETRLGLLLARSEVDANLRQSLLRGTPSAGVAPNVAISYSPPDFNLKVRASWGSGSDSSLHNPIKPGWGGPDELLSDKAPEFFFKGNKSLKAGKTPVALAHTLLRLDSSTSGAGSVEVASYSHLSPYGICAPLGTVSASSVSSFTNPTYDQGQPGIKGDDEKVSLASGRGVDILAGRKLVVRDSFRVGRAISGDGPIDIPISGKGAGAIPLHRSPGRLNFAEPLFSSLTKLSREIARDATDKTELLDDEIFALDTLKRLFRGDINVLKSIIGVGQACKVPFFPLPGVQNSAPLMVVYYIIHPYPVDFGGKAGSHEGDERLGEIGEEIDAKEAKIAEIKSLIAKEREQEEPDEDKILRWKGELSDLKTDIDDLKKEAQNIAKKKNKQKSDLASQLSGTEIPTSAAQDAAIRTKGWSYLYVIGQLFNIVIDLFRGKNPFERIFVPTRVVHLGEHDPDWNWKNDNLDMQGVLTVPPGRTLALKKQEVKVRGDVHLQQGAALYVSGNFTIERPGGWKDFGDAKPSDGRTLSYPKGRLIMEAGSSLVVGGSLNVSGGTFDEGSVMLVAPYGPNRGITSLIYAGNDVKIKYGMTPGATFGQVVDALSKDKPALSSFNKDFFDPFMNKVVPNLAKLPIGPWEWRKPYFAEFATTIEFVPILEEFMLGGPWPVPLPFPNCLRKVFKYVSIVFSCELNALTGENFYTMSSFWIFGRGISPVLLKVRAQLIADSIGTLKWQAIVWDAFKEEGLKFVKEALPDFVKDVVTNIILEVVQQLLISMLPFKIPTCGGKEAKEAEAIKEKAKEFLKDTLKDFGKTLASSFASVVRKMKNEVYYKLDGSDERFSTLRELPGVAVVAGDEIFVGTADTSKMAIGLFVAKRNVRIGCDKTIGSVVALEGDVSVNSLLHYPYYDRASLYNPKKLGVLYSTFQFDIPKGSWAGDAAKLTPRRIAEGYR